MALKYAKVQPTVQEKRYITLQFLEAAYVSGNRVIITPVDTYNLSTLSEEQYTYKDPVETYIIYDERPKVGLLKKFGWFREDEENLPQIAFIPTHLLYDRITGEVVNEVLLEGKEMQQLVQTGESDNYELLPLEIKRGTLIDVFFDFAPDSQAGSETLNAGEFSDIRDRQLDAGSFSEGTIDGPELNGFIQAEDNPFDRPIDSSYVLNRFYVTEPRIDTVSINYTCKLMAYKYDAPKEATVDQNPSNGEYLKFDSDDHGI